MSNIFDLSTDYKQVYDMISQGEDSEVYLDTLDSLNDSIEDKADGYSAIIKSLNGDNEIIKKEIERLQARKKANENGIRNMKDNLQ
ncbi:MAG: siphovirus Gp157 family protein, partial [Staphylococcus equorum]|nr:siphovirus Gp157 family protein [Staphylococcus equorum]